jgi:hypothetical protein
MCIWPVYEVGSVAEKCDCAKPADYDYRLVVVGMVLGKRELPSKEDRGMFRHSLGRISIPATERPIDCHATAWLAECGTSEGHPKAQTPYRTGVLLRSGLSAYMIL